MPQFHPVAKTSDITPGEVLRVEIGEHEIGIYNLDGEYYAISDVCSHAYAQLSEGDVDADEGSVECPLHGASFDIRTGRHLSFPAVGPVDAYDLRVTGDEIEVAIPS